MAKGVRVALSAHVDVHLVDVSLWTGGGRQRHAVGRQAHVGEGAQHVLGIAPRAVGVERDAGGVAAGRSEEHTSELQSLMRISYAVFCLQKKNKQHKSDQ